MADERTISTSRRLALIGWSAGFFMVIFCSAEYTRGTLINPSRNGDNTSSLQFPKEDYFSNTCRQGGQPDEGSVYLFSARFFNIFTVGSCRSAVRHQPRDVGAFLLYRIYNHSPAGSVHHGCICCSAYCCRNFPLYQTEQSSTEIIIYRYSPNLRRSLCTRNSRIGMTAHRRGRIFFRKTLPSFI